MYRIIFRLGLVFVLSAMLVLSSTSPLLADPSPPLGELIINGSFETPETSSFLVVPAGDPAILPWEVGLVSVDVVNHKNPFTPGPAFDGFQYLDLDGTPGPGQITQTFGTKPGVQYQLSFAYSHNFSCGPSSPSATVRVFDGTGDLLGPVVITHSSGGPGDLDWITFSDLFVASESTTTLEFVSLSAGGQCGIFLDGVSVTAVP